MTHPTLCHLSLIRTARCLTSRLCESHLSLSLVATYLIFIAARSFTSGFTCTHSLSLSLFSLSLWFKLTHTHSLTHTHTYLHRLNTRKFRSGLAKLGSIRRSAGRLSPKNQISSRPTISAPRPIEPEIESIDGGRLPGSTSSPISSEEVDGTVTRSAEQLPATGLRAGDDAPSNLQQKTRRDIISNYRQDTASLDSVSVSSQSEMSEHLLTTSGERCLLAAGEQRCYLHEDLRTEQLLFNGSGVMRQSAEGNLETTLRSLDSAESATVAHSMGTGSSHPLVPLYSEDDYDHLEDADVLPYIQNGDVTSHPHHNRLASVDFERTPQVREDHLLSTITGQELWKNSVVQVESDSDSETTNKDSPTAKFTVGSVGKQEFTQSLPDSIYSAVETGRPKKRERPNEAHYYNFSVLMSEVKYANVFIPGPGGNAYGQSTSPVRKLRPRSKSSSPYNSKKPVPLPRRVSNGQIIHPSNDLCASSEKKEFFESLPANFKPQPPPKPTSLPGFANNVSEYCI